MGKKQTVDFFNFKFFVKKVIIKKYLKNFE